MYQAIYRRLPRKLTFKISFVVGIEIGVIAWLDIAYFLEDWGCNSLRIVDHNRLLNQQSSLP